MIGTTIGHYHILDKLGEGGMGVVYRATDLTLDRMVALKFLPAHVSATAETKARFLQEAKAAAALNHANICTVHGVEESDDSMFIVMEYVDGGTLRTKIPFSAVDSALTTASQIAEALQEAHTKGIVHRDIKADNIMLTSKGLVKVMDFGLAKLKGSLKLTRTSSTVGTLAYMAPEQIQGGEVDARSDVFSFGVLLFEMLTGRTPFRGEHQAAMVYSIVNEEPQNIVALVPELSPIVVNLIQRCLEKDPTERYQHFDDIVADLKRAQKKTSRVMRSSGQIPTVASAHSIASSETARSAAPAPTKRTFFPKIVVGSIGLLSVVALAIWHFSGPTLPGINPDMEVSTLQIPAIEYQYPGISPDGKWLTFAGADLNGNWDIYMMFIETGENKRITNDSSGNLGNAATARFSPDGSSIVYGRRSKKSNVAEVCVVSVLSGQVRVIADTGVAPQWSPAGDKIFYYRAANSRLYRARSSWREVWSVSPLGGTPEIAFIDSLMKGSTNFFTIGVSPNGKKIVFTRPTGGSYNEIFVRDLETGIETQITHDQKEIDEAVWSDNGYILFTSNRSGNFNIWAVPETGGEPKQVTRGTGPDNGVTVSTSANRMVFSQRTNVSVLWMVNTDGTGSRQVYPDENISLSHVSPDGNTIALQIDHPTMRSTLMVREIVGARQEILFPFDSTVGRYDPIWSPSGTLLSFVEERAGGRLAYLRVIDLSGGRRIRDLGEGVLNQWLSDTVVIVARNDSPIPDQPRYRASRLLNLRTGSEKPIFRDSVLVLPILGGTRFAYLEDDEVRSISSDLARQNPSARGSTIMKLRDLSGVSPGDRSLYYRLAATGALWKMDWKTLQRTKLIDIPRTSIVALGPPDYRDKIVTYSVRRLKTTIVKIDGVFTGN